MIQPGEKFEVNGITLEAVTTTKELGCLECEFLVTDAKGMAMGCGDPLHDHDCFDDDKDLFVIFKEVTE